MIFERFFMKFIFPQNFNFRNKLLGIIDYPTAIFNLLYFLLIWFIVSLFTNNFSIKVLFIILLYLPLFLLSIIDFNHENILYSIWYIIKYFLNPKIYLYK